jgi:hypothetical protein
LAGFRGATVSERFLDFSTSSQILDVSLFRGRY